MTRSETDDRVLQFRVQTAQRRFGFRWLPWLRGATSLRRVVCLLTIVLLWFFAREYIAANLRRTIADECPATPGSPLVMVFDNTTDAIAWGRESWVRRVRRRVRQRFADVPPVRAMCIRGVMRPVKHLTPVTLFPELRELEMDWTAVTDLSPLKHCRNLEKLSCAHTFVEDFACLRKLRNLQQLNLADTAIADLAPLTSLHALRSLNLDDTKVTSVVPLAGLECLEDLSLNRVTEIQWESFGELSGLRSLSLLKTQIADLCHLRNLKGLRSLVLRNTSVADLSPLEQFPDLEVLDIRGIQVSDFSIFPRMTELKELYVTLPADSGPVLALLAEATQLQSLGLEVEGPLEWQALEPLSRLQRLTLSGHMDSLDGIEAVPGIESLDLVEMEVDDFKALRSLPELRRVVLIPGSRLWQEIEGHDSRQWIWDPNRKAWLVERVLDRQSGDGLDRDVNTSQEAAAKDPSSPVAKDVSDGLP